ncbi:hypothetical protein LTR85_011707 [Meristemomyces frigidus]|nr:hypothetical protein LTR85_011707 [Meristemomyces frigidus]
MDSTEDATLPLPKQSSRMADGLPITQTTTAATETPIGALEQGFRNPVHASVQPTRRRFQRLILQALKPAPKKSDAPGGSKLKGSAATARKQSQVTAKTPCVVDNARSSVIGTTVGRSTSARKRAASAAPGPLCQPLKLPTAMRHDAPDEGDGPPALGSTLISSAMPAGGEAGECPTCKPLLRVLEKFNYEPNFLNPRDIAKQAERGCSVCTMLNAAVSFIVNYAHAEPREDAFHTLHADSKMIMRLWGDESNLSFRLFRTVNSSFDRPWRTAQEATICQAIPVEPALPLRTDDSQCLTWRSILTRVKKWLSQCQTQHHMCSASGPTSLPSRVVEIMKKDGVPKLRLHESQDEHAEYVALSHCWGEPSLVVKTMGATLGSHCNEIEWDSLSKTFQDAVHVTADLGYSYLWIDSLCILQDDADDWATEASKMGGIYEGATIVLAAASSGNGSGGLFYDRSNQQTLITDPAGSQVVVRVLDDHHFAEALCYHQWRFDWSQYPWRLRKWTTQERLLCRRIVYYTAHELVWECRTATLCECGAYNSGDRKLESDKSRFARALLQSPDSSLTENALEHPCLQAWYPVVENYSAGSLTIATDVLPAISGVVRTLSGKGLGKYLAGIWQADLLCGLCWKTVLTSRTRRPPQFCAPSWSWASVQGRVLQAIGLHPDDPDATDLAAATIVAAHCTPAGLDPFGHVSDGLIKIRAPALQLRVLRVDVSNSEHPTMLMFEGIDHPQEGFIDTLDDRQALAGNDVWIVCLFRSGNSVADASGYLILRINGDGTFRRCGMMAFYHEYHTDEEAEGCRAFIQAVETAHEEEFDIV